MIVSVLLAAAAAAHAACLPAFPYEDGWLGGDAAYSVRLPDGRSLWLFGDSFIGKPGASDRKGASMIANSVAVSSCGRAGFDLAYHWRGGDSPGAFFEAGEKGLRYWPFGAFARGSAVYVALGRVRTTGTGPFDFGFEGTDLARILPSSAPPSEWPVSVVSVSTEAWISPAGAVADGHDAYLLLADARPGRRHAVHLARVAWSGGEPAGLEPERALFEPGSSELSVARRGRRWVAVYSQEGLPSPRVVTRTAPRLEGPWSEERPLFENPRRDGVFCYAGKEHPELGLTPMIVTYACNTFKPEDVLGDMGLYRPEVKSVHPGPQGRESPLGLP